tara:strand:+ start:674 stop:853 length:180 start_codon:yes stop_codon:yes gene_type:complete
VGKTQEHGGKAEEMAAETVAADPIVKVTTKEAVTRASLRPHLLHYRQMNPPISLNIKNG